MTLITENIIKTVKIKAFFESIKDFVDLYFLDQTKKELHYSLELTEELRRSFINLEKKIEKFEAEIKNSDVFRHEYSKFLKVKIIECDKNKLPLIWFYFRTKRIPEDFKNILFPNFFYAIFAEKIREDLILYLEYILEEHEKSWGGKTLHKISGERICYNWCKDNLKDDPDWITFSTYNLFKK